MTCRPRKAGNKLRTNHKESQWTSSANTSQARNSPEAIGNVVVIAIMATAAGIDWKIYGRKTRRRTPPSIDTPQRRRRAAQRRTIPAGHIDE